jgi:hypothetical protein
VQGIKQKMEENDELARQFMGESYAHKKHAASARSRAGSLEQEARSLRAKLKYERESKRATQQKIWAMNYDTSLVAKGNLRKGKLRRAQEDDLVHW